MSYVDDLLAAYAKFVALPWQQNLAPPQRVWMAVYPPEHERRLRLHLPAFKAATTSAKHHLGVDRHHDRRSSAGWRTTSTATRTSKIPSSSSLHCLRSSTISSVRSVMQLAAHADP